MRKKLNETAMENELAGSVYFNPNLTPEPGDKKLVKANPETKDKKPEEEGTFTKIMRKAETDVPSNTDRLFKATTAPSSKVVSNVAINIASNIEITEKDIEDLKDIAYKAQTFRFTEKELDSLKDRAYSFSKTLKRKITQGDLLRIGFLLFEKNLDSTKESIIELLKEL